MAAYLDLLGRQEVPVGLKFSRLDLLVVNEHLVRIVGLHDQSVQVGVHVVLATDVLLDQMVLALVAEDHVNLREKKREVSTEDGKRQEISTSLFKRVEVDEL